MQTESQTIEQQTTKCPAWCTKHVSDGEGGIVHKAAVTVGEATVELEYAPNDDPPHNLPILLPEWTDCDTSAACDLALALIKASQLVESEWGQR